MTAQAATESQLANRLAAVNARIAAAAERGGRHADAVHLIAVTKSASPTAFLAASRLGLRQVGENRVQDAQAHMAVAQQSGWRPAWHLIGHLQRNKAGHAAACFDSVDSVDSLALAQALSRRATSLGRTVRVLLQVKPMEDATKTGLEPDGILDLAAQVAPLPALRLEGLMSILPLNLDPGAQRQAFSDLSGLFGRLQAALPHCPILRLSMGMTDDFEPAIEQGSTEVRIGRLLFEGL